MHQVAFGAKRAFHGCLRASRKLLASFGLTAARFDLLYALARHHLRSKVPPAMWQSTLRREVGVSAGVVSRMLRSLEDLGWVTRTRCFYDGRQREVALTASGFERLRPAIHIVRRAMARVLEEVVCFGQHRDPSKRLHHLDALEGYHRVLEQSFGPPARLYFPWGHPDD